MSYSLLSLRRDLGHSQKEMARRIGKRIYVIQAAEFGLGHGGHRQRLATDFPTYDFFTAMSSATGEPPKFLGELYMTSCKNGDRQTFLVDELPTERLSDLIVARGFDAECLSQMAAVPMHTLAAIAEGRDWAMTPIVRRIASVLRLPATRLDTILWGAHYRKSQWMEFRGTLTKARTHRPTRIKQ